MAKRSSRLKGGDPFVFGRGGEEASALAEAAVPFEVVPGVTSAVAAPAYAGIPLTHRGVASSFTVVTGSEAPDKRGSAVAWDRLAQATDSLVVLMGWESLASIVEALLRNGMPSETPAALVQWGTEPNQRTVTGDLSNIEERARSAGLGPPVVAVFGEVVRLRDRIRWFDNRPLSGKRVLVTRTRTQAGRLSDLLAQAGAQPIEVPTIEVRPLTSYDELDAALGTMERYDWAVFTSANAVRIVFGRLDAIGLDARVFRGTEVAAIGPGTETGLRERGIVADFVPGEFVSEAVVEGLGQRGIAGYSVLLPRADIGHDFLPRGLAALGASVHEVTAYCTVTPDAAGARLEEALESGIDIATFTSSSTVKNLTALLDGNLDSLKDTTIACIGPITAAAAGEAGLGVDVTATEYTVPGLVDALTAHFSQMELSTNE